MEDGKAMIDEKTGEITSQINSLSRSVDVLQEHFDKLHKAIEPILSSEASEEKCKKEEEPESPVIFAAIIQNERMRIQKVCNSISNLIDRIEL